MYVDKTSPTAQVDGIGSLDVFKLLVHCCAAIIKAQTLLISLMMPPLQYENPCMGMLVRLKTCFALHIY